jgi:hypothetical protein
MQEKIAPLVAKLAELVERARRGCEATAQLLQDYNFMVVWHSLRPRSGLPPHSILLEQDADQALPDALPEDRPRRRG